ncbi:hypothetical protein FNV43_RR25855 [Rhamnella rubrinervis]|uniref:Uncharacterized protein n=1 Tax=Rhamnella rubrinervis TaxID=2594499 RepID=A0A8K0GQX8_9ROSA|nr:hypothetical protein FNV43_RR25855 [Rhamnella rubrinervis]
MKVEVDYRLSFGQALPVLNQTTQKLKPQQRQQNLLVVQAKGKRGMQPRQFQRPPPPALPKIEDDGNPHFVVSIRMANFCSFPSPPFGKKLCFAGSEAKWHFIE